MRRGGWCCITDGCISMNRMGDERGLLVDLGQERPRVSASARNLSPIVPRGSIAGRALVAVVAIMTFLASMTTGAVLLISASAAEWQSEVASEITIQVRPPPGAPAAGGRYRTRYGGGSRSDQGAAGHRRCQAFHQGPVRQIAGAMAGHRNLHCRTARAQRRWCGGGAR